jgi:Right handed beta helix region
MLTFFTAIRSELGRSAMSHSSLLFIAAALFVLSSSGSPVQAASAPSILFVPTEFPTIQSAVNAAKRGDTVQVSAGTYAEQLHVTKDLAIVGAGMDTTIIRAPTLLKGSKAHGLSIVEISDGAIVTMSQLTVKGPGAGTCANGALHAGIRVRGEAHLDLSYSAVRDVHDSPIAPCFHSGTGILVGDVPKPTASLNIHHSEITNYQSAGIVILGFGSTAVITDNIVTGPGSGVATDGIEFPVGSVGTVTHNTVSGNICPPGDAECGPDWFTQFQHAGIVAGGWGPGTVVSNNFVFGNQIGLLLGESDEISDNQMVGNDFFGLGLFDGSFLIDGAQITGGGGGVWVIAVSANSNVILKDVTFSGLSGPEVDTVECCGFTATVTP